MLRAYHLCMWLDDMITYEDVAGRKLSIYNLVPLRAFSYVAIDTLNDNCTETGICIHPKLPIFKSFSIMDDGTEKEKTMSCRDAFTGMNGELRKISYCKWSSEYIVHNVIIPYEYVEKDERSAKGNLRIGFIPISDKTDLIVPDYKIVKDGKYQMNKMYIDHPRHEEVIHTRLRHGFELACRNKADIVFSPEMLGTDQTEKQQGNYNEFVRQVYDEAVMNDHKPPMITVVPTRWCRGINSASIVYRDGRILGRQKKYTPYINFKCCSAEGLRPEKTKELYLIHVYGVHRIAISICAEFIDGFDSNFICGQLGATLVIVPSFSHGERDFVNQLGTLFPYGTSVVWGDCCGAVVHSPKIIGGCSLIGANEIHKMGDNCKCKFSCDGSKGCLFLIELPLQVMYSKSRMSSHQPVRHILQ